MTCTCTHTAVDVYSRQDRFDPTRTTSLRAAWVSEMNKRFRRLRGLINQAIVEQDCFGMMSVYIPLAHRAFAFPRTSDKIAGFMKWIDQQVQNGILQVGDISQIGKSIDGAWTNKYVYDSYKRGVIRARYELDKNGFKVPSMEATGGIGASMSTPFHMDRVGALYTRVFTGLKGITDTMDQQISQVLGEGLINGDHPRLLARKLNSVISGQGRQSLGITDSLGRSISPERRARMLARTEVIRAHHQAVVQEYENWKVEGVNVMAEWVSAGYNVCPECQDLEVGGPYTLEEVRDMLPAHPDCRCTTIPVKVEDVSKKEGEYLKFSEKNVDKATSFYRDDRQEVKQFLEGSEFHSNAVRAYTSHAYEGIQKSVDAGMLNNYARGLEELITSNPIKRNLELVRVEMKKEKIQQYLNAKVGSVFSETRFTSASLVNTEKLGTLWTSEPGKNVNLIIQAKKGQAIANISNLRELEYVVQRNSSFKILKKEGQNIWVRLQ